MSQPSNSYNSHFLARATSILLQGAIERDTAAKHRRRMLTADPVRILITKLEEGRA